MKMNLDDQKQTIFFAFAAAIALALISSIEQFAILGSLRAMNFALPFYMRYENAGLNVYRFIAELVNYLRGAGIFMIVRAAGIHRKNLPYSAAMITGIACFVLPSALRLIMTYMFRFYVFY